MSLTNSNIPKTGLDPALAAFLSPASLWTPSRIEYPYGWVEHLPFAFWLVGAARPTTLVELGTHSGNSFCAFCQAVDTLGLETRCFAVDTWEGDSHAGFYDARVYKELLAYQTHKYGRFSRLIRTEFDQAQSGFGDGSIDILHIDGLHTYEAVRHDFEYWRPKLSERAVVLVHDTNVHERGFGVYRFWEEVAAEFAHFEFVHGHGLGVLGVGRDLPSAVRDLFSQPGEVVTRIRQLYWRLGSALSQVFEGKREIERLQGELTTLEGVRGQLENRIAKVAQLEELAQSRREQITNLEGERSELRDQLEIRNAKVAQLEELRRSRRDQVGTLERKHAELSGRIECLERAQSSTSGELDLRRRSMRDLQGRLSTAERNRESTLRMLEAARSAAHMREETIKSLHARQSTLRRSLLRQTRSSTACLAPRPRSSEEVIQCLRLALATIFDKRAFHTRTSFRGRAVLAREGMRLIWLGVFDSAWYAYDAGLTKWMRPESALMHWLERAITKRKDPHPLFNTKWYLSRHSAARKSGLNPLAYYLGHGASLGQTPSPLFDPVHYLETYPDVRRLGDDPWLHYVMHGQNEDRLPNPFFDPRWYRRQYKLPPHLDPLRHYLLAGARLGYSPGPDFDSAWYLETYSDVARVGVNPLRHYLQFGRAEGRRALPPPRPPSLPDAPHPEVAPRARVSDPCRYSYIEGDVPREENKPAVLLCAHAANAELFGGERSFLEILQLINELPYQAYVLLPKANPDYVEALKSSAVGIVCIPYQFWHEDREPDQAAVASMMAFMVDRRISLVHVNTIMVREPLIAARRLGLCTLTHVRESLANDRWICDRLGLEGEGPVQSILDSTDYVIANSKHAAKEFHKADRTFVVPNTFEMDALDLANDVGGGELIIGLISSNLPKKGIEDFAQLATACAERLPNLRFCLIGPLNAHTEDLQQRQAAGAIAHNLEFAGYQKSPAEALLKINIVVNFSHFAETFGRTVVEAQAARRPAIVYDLGFPKALIREGVTGYVLPVGQWEKAIPILEELDRNRSRIQEMGCAGREHVLPRYARSAGRDSLRQAYDAALAGHPLPVDPAGRRDRIAPSPRYGSRDAVPRTQPPRIAYFCWHFPVPSETFVLNELRQLVSEGVDVRVYCRQIPHPDMELDFPIQWERVTGPDELAQALQETGRDHVHAHFVYPTVTDMVWPACRKIELPFTLIAHAQDIFKHENARRNRIDEIAADHLCKGVFVLGRFHRRYLRERGVPEEKIIVNPNAVDFSRFPFTRRTDLGRRKKVCAIHRLTEKKGLRYLVDGAEILRDEGLEFNLYGYGDEEEALAAAIKEKGLDSVHLRGRLDGAEAIRDTLACHDAFLAPSVRTESGDMDGIPTSLIEAMAVGVPVVSTHISSIPDVVRDGETGFLAEPNDAESLANAIRALYTRTPEELSAIAGDARALVASRHDSVRLTRVLRRVWADTPIDIVIVSWNNLEELTEVIRRLFALTKTPFHLTVCDNASDDGIVRFLCDLQVRHENVTVVFREENTYVGPGTNRAAEQGRAPYIVYFCGKEAFVLQEGWEMDVIEYMDRHPRVGLAGTLGYSPTYYTGKEMPGGVRAFPNFRNPEFAAEHPDRVFYHVQGGLFCFRREMFESIGGFSETVPHGHTDVEYSYYAESRGWELGSISGMLALFNKTRPNLWSRVTAQCKVIHPPRLEELPVLDRLVDGAVEICPVCEASFDSASRLAECPKCSATGSQRALVRALGCTDWTYRKQPVLAAVSSPSVLRVLGTWFSVTEFSPERADRLDLPQGSDARPVLILMDRSEANAQASRRVASIFGCVLHSIPADGRIPEATEQILRNAGFVPENTLLLF